MAMRRIFVCLIIIALAATVPCAAQDTSKNLDADMVDFISKYRQAFQEKNIEAVMALYAPGQQAVLMGTGPGERYEGQDEIRAAHLKYFDAYDTEESKNTWHKIWVKGDIALVAVQTYITAYAKNVKEEFAINWTAAMEKQGGKWVFLVRHLSNLSCED